MANKNALTSPPDLIEEAMQQLRRMVKALESYSRGVEDRLGLTGPQLWALWELHKAGTLAHKELAARMHLGPSTLVGVVDRLIAKGMVHRSQDQVDRRRVCLALTDAGRRVCEGAPDPAQGKMVQGLQRLSAKQLADLNRTLRLLVEAMEADKIEARFFFSEE